MPAADAQHKQSFYSLGVKRTDDQNFAGLKPPPCEAKGKVPCGWAEPWFQASKENPWLLMGWGEECGDYPWCGLCGKWASLDHLSSDKCKKRRQNYNVMLSKGLEQLISDGEGYPTGTTVALSQTEPEPEKPEVAPRWQRRYGSGRRCGNPQCSYLAHDDDEKFQGYCCKACGKWHKDGCKKTNHGKMCQRRPADGAPGERPSRPPPEETPGAVPQPEDEPEASEWREWEEWQDAFTFETNYNVISVVATEGIDVASPECTELKPGVLTGSRVVVLPGEGTEVLRLQMQGPWITLAERNAWTWEVLSNFKEPARGWRKVFYRAQWVEEDWQEADELAKKAEYAYDGYKQLQDDLRNKLHENFYEKQQDALNGALAARWAVAGDALKALEEFEEKAMEAEGKSHWYGGLGRLELLEDARQRIHELKDLRLLDVEKEMKHLAKNHAKVTLARKQMRNADTALQNELEEQDLAESRENEVAGRLKAERDACRKYLKAATRKYFQEFARLSKLADHFAPEMLRELRRHAEMNLKIQLFVKLRPQEQAEVWRVLDVERSISHYDPEELSKATRLSGREARHAVYQMEYEGEKCVVKVFDLHTHRGLPGFIQEVMLHVRLRHPLVVPLRRAFIDFKEHRGFLHFDLYACNLNDHLKKLSQPKRVPHCYGEPSEVGQVDRMPRRIAQLMVQAVAHVHSHGVVHGDLKPSNWLWDERRKVPILCDFETAKEHGLGMTMTQKLVTKGYVAPELEEDPSARPTLESDVFSLGQSIRELLQGVSSCSTPSDRRDLEELVQKMQCCEPKDRITAADAAAGWWSEMLSDPMGREHWVPANEVRYTQGECSGQFSDGQTLDQLIQAIERDPEYPLKDERLIIDVVKKGSALLSVDNRRLHCFHEAQKRRRDVTVWIKVREHQYSKVQQRFVNHFSTRNGGREIYVRRSFCERR